MSTLDPNLIMPIFCPALSLDPTLQSHTILLARMPAICLTMIRPEFPAIPMALFSFSVEAVRLFAGVNLPGE